MRVAVIIAIALAVPARANAQVFDSHVHLWHGEQSLVEYEKQAKGLGEIGFAGMWFGGPNQALAGDGAAIRANNDAQLALAARHPEMVPVATVHPYDGEVALEEVGRLARLGFKMLKLHPHTQRFDPADSRVLDVAKRAGKSGLIVLIDNADILPGDCEKLFNLALQAPDTKFIFAHLGATNFRFWNVLRLARTAQGVFAENIFFDISATIALFADSPIETEFIWTMRNVGVDRILLGSDYPQFTLTQTLAAFDKLNLTADEKSAIRFRNAERLLGLKATPRPL